MNYVNQNNFLNSIYFSIIISLIFPQSSKQMTNNISNNPKQVLNSTDIDKTIKQAKVLERNGMIEEAERIYKDLLVENPKNNQIFQLLKILLKNQQRYNDLISIAEVFYKNNPKMAHIKIDVMEIYLWNNNKKWLNLAKEIFNSNKKNLSIIKQFVNRIIYNGELTIAIKYINEIREKEKPEFYSMELGTYYRTRMAYKESLENYLLYLEHKPNTLQTVSNWVMTYPDDPIIQQNLKQILLSSNLPESKLIMSDLEFKQGNFEQSYELMKNNYKDPKVFIDFLQQLIYVAEFNVSLEIFSNIINTNTNTSIVNAAVFGMANILENKSINSNTKLPISGFYNGNEFFESPYYDINEKFMPSLWKAINIYDSLRISKDNKNINSTFRLAEIKFKAMNDLDGAFNLYTDVAKKSTKRSERFLAALAIIDIMIAKNNLKLAKEQIQIFKKKFTYKEEKIVLKIKECQINFYSGELIMVNDSLKTLLTSVSYDEQRYNDLLDIQSIGLIFWDELESFKKFTNIQLLVRQNKRTQALEMVKNLAESNNIFIASLATFQLAYINLIQKEYYLALENLEIINDGTIFFELSQIMKAEIFDYILKDQSKAIDLYLLFLEKYPTSIYYDDIRVRLRELAS